MAATQFLSIIGVGIDPSTETPDLYLLVVDDESATIRPVMRDGYMLFFTDIGTASFVLQHADAHIAALGPPPTEEAVLVDLTQTLYLLENEDVDNSSTLLNFFNVSLDLIKATDFVLPTEYELCLTEFANHLTFNREYASFFATTSVARAQITAGVLLLVGAIVSTAQVISNKTVL